jgi:BCD family chlorophyll transporter-like MFS transporter
MGAWGVANALSRFIGTLMGGMIRDLFSGLLSNPVSGYLIVFILEACMLFVSVILLRKIDVTSFKKQVSAINLNEKAAMLNDLT